MCSLLCRTPKRQSRTVISQSSGITCTRLLAASVCLRWIHTFEQPRLARHIIYSCWLNYRDTVLLVLSCLVLLLTSAVAWHHKTRWVEPALQLSKPVQSRCVALHKSLSLSSPSRLTYVFKGIVRKSNAKKTQRNPYVEKLAKVLLSSLLSYLTYLPLPLSISR